MSSPATELRRSTRPRSKPAYADPDSDHAELERGGKRRRNAAATTRKSGAGKDKPKAAKRPVEEAVGAIDDNDDVCPEEPDAEEMQVQEEEEAERIAAEAAQRAAAEAERVAPKTAPGARKRRVAARPRKKAHVSSSSSSSERFVGDTIPDHEARRRWPERYTTTTKDSEDPNEMGARCHYTSALVDHAIIHLGDDVYVKAPTGEADFIGRITEFFQGIDRGSYFSSRWFYRVEDTVISPKLLLLTDNGHNCKRVFLSEVKDCNMIESIISKVNITYVDPNVTAEEKDQLISNSDLYYDMMYSVPYSTFSKIPPENGGSTSSEATSDISSDDADCCKEKPIVDIAAPPDAQMKTVTLLDLYSGCGAMSTGLCLGAASAGLKLDTKWAVDMNKYACESLKKNHPSTQVRTEKAENFLSLLKHWDALCQKYDVQNSNSVTQTPNDDEYDKNETLPEGTFEVEKLVDVCYGDPNNTKNDGDPNNTKNDGLWFKVRWKKYDDSYDTWEPLDGLSDSPGCIKEFVESGYKESILPLPGCVDVLCGGPPCQGISGLNRFRKPEAPLTDERNKQLVVFMDIVKYLRPKYVLMENVVDILKFADGFLGRYALSRLVAMGYQARVGMMVAGCYGLPQFRMRAFLWGALPSMVLPKFPLPTHDAVNRGVVPTSFSQCLVTYGETEAKCVEKALVLRDVISNLPKVGNDQPNDVMKFGIRPKTQFQRYIRQNRKDMENYSVGDSTPKDGQLFDHQPLKLNINDHERVRQIPVKKGANFRNLKGVRVGENNTVEFDPAIPRVYLPSGKPLVPNYAMTFIKGRSLKPFGRLWWDETVGTVVTRAEPHNQIILHPNQDRVLTVRENARLQGFPDYYRLCGPIKQKYIQVGNAVAVPVARALGYSLGQAYQKEDESHGDQHPQFKLPENFIPVTEPTVARRLFPGTVGGEEVVMEE